MTVHPRVCGERTVQRLFTKDRYGSSPRVRGTLAVVLVFSLPDRFIPACAGNAASSSARAGRTPVHPRVCGERARFFLPPWQFYGSSPRVRGTPVRDQRNQYGKRFIPACAGNA